MATTQCTECDETIELAGRGRIGQKVVCPQCGAALEVVAIEPLELDLAQDDDDGWDDELDALDGEDEIDDEDDIVLEDDFDDEADELDDDFEDDDFEDGDDDGDDDDRAWT